MVRPIINAQPAEANEMEEMRKAIRDFRDSVYDYKIVHMTDGLHGHHTHGSQNLLIDPNVFIKHFQRDCPQRQNYRNRRYKRETPNTRQKLMMSSAGMYAKGQVEGHNVECLVDTGATLTLISKSVWDLIKDIHQLTEVQTPLLSASGNNLTVHGCTDLVFKLAGKAYPTKVVVADLNISVVIGIDFMTEHNPIIDVGRDTLYLGTKQWSYIVLVKWDVAELD